MVVNGASGGIGYAVVEAMAEAGADVALWYDSNDAATSKGDGLAKKHGIRARAYQVQVTDPTRVDEAMKQVVSDFGKLDVRSKKTGELS